MTAIQKILIPTDYSVTAKNASEIGLKLAKKLNAEVLLFHSYHFPLTTSEDMVYISEMREGELKKLGQEKNRLLEIVSDISIMTDVQYGSAVDLISALISKENVDLIVMGTQGETNAFDAVLGSVATNVVNHAMCSTLIIPGDAKSGEFNQLMLAADFQRDSEAKVYKPLLHLLDVLGASLAIVNVQTELDLSQVPTKTEELTNNLFEGYKHSHHYLESQNTEDALFDFANTHDCDLIVLLTKHYSLWERLWHKSLTKKVALHTTKPLLILHDDV